MRAAAILLLCAAATLWAQDVPTQDAASGRALIDEQVGAKQTDLGLKAVGRSEDSEFVRRVYLDLVGTIPTLEQAERFMADRSSERRARLIEDLLASDEWAQNWAWQMASTLVGQTDDGRGDGAALAVARELKPLFARNDPLDAIARHVIGASGRFELPRGQDMKGMMEAMEGANGMALFYFSEQRRAGRDLPMALANKFSRIFLGIQISCAQCHDHPFDRWTQEDFYGMAAFFTEVSVRPLRKDGEKQPYGYEVLDRQTPRRRMGAGLVIPDSKRGPVKPAWLETKAGPEGDAALRQEFARLLTAPSNGQFARAGVNHVWARLFGRGIVNPPDDFNGRNKPSHPELLEALAGDFQAHRYDIKWLVREICNSQAYQRTSRVRQRDASLEKYYAVAAVRALTPEQIVNAVVTASLVDPSHYNLLQRVRLLRDFRSVFEDDEGKEITEFEGTIPGALLMMNGAVIAQATTTGRPGTKGPGRPRRPMAGRAATRLAQILEGHAGAEERLRAIFLAVLSRPPTSHEGNRYLRYVASRGEGGFEDVMWALLNSSEFLFNH